jgi:hypothetical protein
MARLVLFFLLLFPVFSYAAMPNEEIAVLQRAIAGWHAGERIAFWAEKFVDTPYDPDPLGEYVRKNVVVADDRVDCMYLTFRSVELAFGKDPDAAISVALDKRFVTRGRIGDGKVLNYEDRFRYGEDMIDSRKWGTEITSDLGQPEEMPGVRGRETVSFLTVEVALKGLDLLENGDIVFFVNSPDKMPEAGIIGHMGIIKREEDTVYLIHASGRKNYSGKVKKVLFRDYLQTMPFVGIRVTRFETN